MRICYFYSSMIFGHDSPEQRALASVSIASVRRHMPDRRILHLTDHKTKTLDGVDEVMAINWRSSSNRGDAHALIQGAVLFLDTDTVVTKDLSPVFGDPKFDIAVALRAEDSITPTMRYNGGVIFSRNEHVFKDVADRTRALGGHDEEAFNEVLLNGKYKVLELPTTYNFTPPEVAVYHFKGPRKKLMLDLGWH